MTPVGSGGRSPARYSPARSVPRKVSRGNRDHHKQKPRMDSRTPSGSCVRQERGAHNRQPTRCRRCNAFCRRKLTRELRDPPPSERRAVRPPVGTLKWSETLAGEAPAGSRRAARQTHRSGHHPRNRVSNLLPHAQSRTPRSGRTRFHHFCHSLRKCESWVIDSRRGLAPLAAGRVRPASNPSVVVSSVTGLAGGAVGFVSPRSASVVVYLPCFF